MLSSITHGNAIVVRDHGLVSVNVKPSGCFFRNWISRSERTEALSGDINANTSEVVFWGFFFKLFFLVSNLRHNLSLSPSEDKCKVTLDTSQVA